MKVVITMEGATQTVLEGKRFYDERVEAVERPVEKLR
jgi:hypothetical protein